MCRSQSPRGRRLPVESLERRMLLSFAPAGGEFQPNTTTDGAQNHPAVAMDGDGDYVIAWDSRSGYDLDVYARRYDAAGNAQGDEFRVNTFTTNTQSGPAVAMDPDGDFVITWSSYLQDGSRSGVYAQRYDAAGRAVGPEFRVNSEAFNG